MGGTSSCYQGCTYCHSDPDGEVQGAADQKSTKSNSSNQSPYKEFIELVEQNRLPSEGAPKIFYNEVIMQTILDLLDPKTDVVSLGIAYKAWSSHFFRICKIKEVLIFPQGLNDGPSYLVFMEDSKASQQLSIEERKLCQKAASGNLDSPPMDTLFNPVDIHANRSRLPSAFLAVRKDKTGFAFGDPASGGNAKAVRKQLEDIHKVFSTISAFLVLKLDRSIVCWGNTEEGGVPPERTTGVQQVQATMRAFAVLFDDGTVAATGNQQFGGVLHKQLSDILYLECNERAFSALKEDKSIESWGDPSYQYRDDKPKMDFSSLHTRKIT